MCYPTYDKLPEAWPTANHLFWDSDIGKWIEGASSFLQDQINPDTAINGAIKELVDIVRGTQEPDGYPNIHYRTFR
jgi:DUF1680 family protein